MIENVARYLESGWTVYRPAATQDSYGGVVNTYTSQAAISGRLRPLSGEFRLSADREKEFASHRFYCLPADIRPGDHLRNGTNTYLVKFAADVMSMNRFMQVDVELQ